MKTLLRTIGFSLGLLPMLLLTTSGIASAHVLKEDNGIAGVLHIPPEDNPEAKQPTELDESFGSADNTFSLSDCDCRIVVRHDGRTIQTVIPRPASPGNTLNSVATVNFPAVGVYDVIFEGSAKNGAFHSFSLDYLVRVPTAAGAASQTGEQGQEVAIIGLGSLMVLVMISVTAIRRGGRYAKPHISIGQSAGKS